MNCIVDGVRVTPDEATISIFDIGLLRGYGCFEALRSYEGTPFRLGPHLDRLERSAAALEIPLPPRPLIATWIEELAGAAGDCVVRCHVTGGYPFEPASPPRSFVFTAPIPETPTELRMLPLPAPWHPGGVGSELTGAKTMSYAPNLRASRAAAAAGFHDALLLSREGAVLEGPTFCVGWFADGVLETPSLDLGILFSITRQAVLEAASGLGIQTRDGRFPLTRVTSADEVFAISTIKEVTPITAVGDVTIPRGPQTAAIAAAFRMIVERETASNR
jgi:branched-subunit amino acid aminotransferase/4-amino-4-deoxychorismate lyase